MTGDYAEGAGILPLPWRQMAGPPPAPEVTARLAAWHAAVEAAGDLALEYPGVMVSPARLRDGGDGLTATVEHGDRAESVTGTVDEVAGWLAGNHQAPAAEGTPPFSAAGPAGDSSPGESPAGGED